MVMRGFTLLSVSTQVHLHGAEKRVFENNIKREEETLKPQGVTDTQNCRVPNCWGVLTRKNAIK